MKHKTLALLLIFLALFVYTTMPARANDTLPDNSPNIKSGTVAEALNKIAFLQGAPIPDANYYYFLHVYLFDKEPTYDAENTYIFRQLADFVTEYPEMRKNKIEVILIISHMADTMPIDIIQSYINKYQINFPVVLANSIGNISIPGNIQPSISRDNKSDNCYYRYNTVHHYIANKNGQQLRRFSPKFHDHIDHQQALDWHTVCNIPPKKGSPQTKKVKTKVAQRLSITPFLQGEPNLNAKYYCYIHSPFDPETQDAHGTRPYNPDRPRVYDLSYYTDIVQEYQNMVKHKIEVILIISNPYNIASRPEIKKALLNNKIPFPVVLATDIGPKPLPGDSLRPTEYTHYANHQQITTYYYEYDKNMCIVNASGKTMPTSDWKSLISKKRFPQNKKQQPSLIQKKTKTRTAITPISKIEAIKKLKKEGITEDQYAQKAKDAACADNQEQLSTLIAAGADLYEAFYSSLYNKSTNCQELIIKSPSFDINKTNNQGLTPLGNFCTHTSGGYMPYFLLSVTDPIALKRLLSTPGIDINKADSQGKTPLHHLCHARNSGYLECARILLDEPNINVNARDESGKTPLWHATNENNSHLIRFITDAGGTM